jgi:hypothetical protein
VERHIQPVVRDKLAIQRGSEFALDLLDTFFQRRFSVRNEFSIEKSM